MEKLEGICETRFRRSSGQENELMLQSVEGVYCDGKIKLLEPAPANATGRVIVTFLTTAPVDLGERGIDKQQAADLRRRLAAFAEDWDRPEMDVYDAV